MKRLVEVLVLSIMLVFGLVIAGAIYKQVSTNDEDSILVIQEDSVGNTWAELAVISSRYNKWESVHLRVQDARWDDWTHTGSGEIKDGDTITISGLLPNTEYTIEVFVDDQIKSVVVLRTDLLGNLI